jgi:hypothetical protein
MQNLIGYQGLVGPNPYLEFQGKIPMAGFYTGDAGNLPPTDATGKPIQSFVDYNNNAQTQYQQALAAYNAQPGPAASTPGTTLNSTPQVQTSGSWPGQAQGAAAPGSLMATPAMQEMQAGIAAAQAAKTPQQLATEAQNTAMRNQMLQQQANMSTVQAGNGGFGNMPGGAFNPGSYMPLQSLMPQAAQAAPPAAAGKGPPPSPPDLRQAYLNALANPGPLPKYGAAAPQPGQAPTGAPQQTGAVNAFLAANMGKATPFLNTLSRMQTG